MSEKSWIVRRPHFECDELTPDHRSWPWNGHRYFAYDLVRFLEPERIVELGTYIGTSFFCFCQAIKDGGLKTECTAVDTWAGDEHTGPYDSAVYDAVRETITRYYAPVNARLVRSLFADALPSFEDNSIDLLHIDGLHTYEAVREDFTSWYPKLAENGVVLFHDIADSCGYGSVEFWHELLEKHPGFSFQHSWGLGVLFPKGDLKLQALIAENLEDKRLVYQYMSELDLVRIQKDFHEDRGSRQDALIKYQEGRIEELSSHVTTMSAHLEKMQQSKLWPVFSRLSGCL